MAQKELEIENEESAGKFERFLFLMIPIIFTLVLLGVLLTLFNMDIRNNVLKVANKIPVVEKWIPEPSADPSAEGLNETEQQSASDQSVIKELKAQLAQKDDALKKAGENKEEQTKQIEALQAQIGQLQAQSKAAETAAQAEPAAGAETEDKSYEQQVKDMAKLYAGMKASKAAPILENMTPEEVTQILSEMNNESKSAILEKMNPKTAADVSVKLKESVNSSDMAIAALQSRLKQGSAAQSAAPAQTGGNLDKEKLNQTFTSMPAAEAAVLLGDMYKISPDKVITILSTVGDSARSSILGQMTKKDSTVAAKIVNRLMGGK